MEQIEGFSADEKKKRKRMTTVEVIKLGVE